MDISKLIPIDFSRNITPFVIGDEIYNKSFNLKFKIHGRDGQLESCNTPASDDNNFFVVSYADRQNTGTQPVGGDVFVDADWGSGNENKEIKASALIWEIDSNSNIETWKPNHEAMLEQWQTKQLVEESERMNNIAMNGNDGDHYGDHHIEMQSEDMGTPTNIDYVIKPDAGRVDDSVKNPNHYKLMKGVESIEIIARSMTEQQWHGFCLGNIIKYRLRAGKKDSLNQDIDKANFYSDLFDMHVSKCINH